MPDKKKCKPKRGAEAAKAEKKIVAKTKASLSDEDLDKVVGGAMFKKGGNL